MGYKSFGGYFLYLHWRFYSISVLTDCMYNIIDFFPLRIMAENNFAEYLRSKGLDDTATWLPKFEVLGVNLFSF